MAFACALRTSWRRWSMQVFVARRAWHVRCRCPFSSLRSSVAVCELKLVCLTVCGCRAERSESVTASVACNSLGLVFAVCVSCSKVGCGVPVSCVDRIQGRVCSCTSCMLASSVVSNRCYYMFAARTFIMLQLLVCCTSNKLRFKVKSWNSVKLPASCNQPLSVSSCNQPIQKPVVRSWSMMRGFWTTTFNLSRVHSGPVSLDPTQNPIVSPCSQCISKDAFNSTPKLGPVSYQGSSSRICSSRHQGKETLPRTRRHHIHGSHLPPASRDAATKQS